MALLVGDGGFLYNPVIQALGASKQHDLPILIVIFNNKGYMAMQKGHVHHYPDGAAENAHVHLGSRLNGFDYRSLGRAFRPARRARRSTGQAQSALQTGLKKVQDGTTAILNVMVSKRNSLTKLPTSARLNWTIPAQSGDNLGRFPKLSLPRRAEPV